MNVQAIEDTGNEAVVRQEVAHSLLFSQLVETGICPNYLKIYDVFLHPHPPATNVWGSQAHPTPNGTEYNYSEEHNHV